MTKDRTLLDLLSAAEARALAVAIAASLPDPMPMACLAVPTPDGPAPLLRCHVAADVARSLSRSSKWLCLVTDGRTVCVTGDPAEYQRAKAARSSEWAG